MPVYSMTGYASACAQPVSNPETGVQSAASVSVEARSVNGRFLDLSFRMPEDLRGLEPALRDIVGQHIKRGKIEIRINTQRDADTSWPQPQPEQLNRLARLEGTVQTWLPKAQ